MKRFNPKRLLILGYFWRYGIIALIFVLPAISYLIFSNINSLQLYTPYALFISIGLPMCAMGIDYILGCIFEFDHIILVNTSASHGKMDPYNLTWNVSKKEFIFIGSFFLLLGIAFIILPFIAKTNINA